MSVEHEPNPWTEGEPISWRTDTGALCSYQVDMFDEDDIGVAFCVTSGFPDIDYCITLEFTNENFPVAAPGEPVRIEDLRFAIARILSHFMSELSRPVAEHVDLNASFARRETH